MPGRTREQKRRDKVLASHRRVGNALYSGTGLPSWLLRLCWWRSLPRTEWVRDVTMASVQVIALVTEVVADDRRRVAHQGPYRLAGFQWWNPLHWVALLSRVIQRATHRRQVERKRKLCAYHFGQRLLRADWSAPPVLESADREAFWALLHDSRFGSDWVPVLKVGELIRQDRQDRWQDHRQRMEQMRRDVERRLGQDRSDFEQQLEQLRRESKERIRAQEQRMAQIRRNHEQSKRDHEQWMEQMRRERERHEQRRRDHEQQIAQLRQQVMRSDLSEPGFFALPFASREAEKSNEFSIDLLSSGPR